MKLLFDAFCRAALYVFLPRVLWWSLLPLAVAAVTVIGAAWWLWPPLLATLDAGLHRWTWTAPVMGAFESWLGLGATALLAPLLLLLVLAPMAALGIMLTVALHTTPRIVSLVAARRFPDLQRRQGAAIWQSVLWSVACTLGALVALLLSLPLWLVPVLGALVPPLIWGWFTAKVMMFDVLADHATAQERRALLKQHAGPLLVMGVVSGYLGLLPAVIWTLSPMGILLMPVFIGAAVWLYVGVFVLVALWFTHYGLSALQTARILQEGEVLPPAPPIGAEAQPTSQAPSKGSVALPLSSRQLHDSESPP